MVNLVGPALMPIDFRTGEEEQLEVIAQEKDNTPAQASKKDEPKSGSNFGPSQKEMQYLTELYRLTLENLAKPDPAQD